MVIAVRATYRVQLTPAFDLDRAAGLIPHLARLGISHLYTSPIAEATVGSSHGYDVTDHGRVRAELGGDAALRRLWRALDEHGMGQVVDLVPNHMGIRDPANRWWQDVLREGPASRFSGHFDIDWSAPDPASHGKVVLPFLGGTVEEAVADGSLRVVRRADGPDLEVVHHADRWPASEASLAVLGLAPSDCAERVEGALADLHASPDTMHRFLDAQHWRPVPWREAATALNWRRFFDVTDLASVRVERPEVFDDVHALLRSWLDDDLGGQVVQGIRVDHVDGLVDPQGYLERLRQVIGADRLLVVEKILAADEAMPPGWPVDGTTGYEVLARFDEAVTDPTGAPELARLARASGGGGVGVGDERSWPQLELDCKHLVADRLLRPEVDRLTRAVGAALAADVGVAPPAGSVRDVVVELAVRLGVYRTYARPGGTGLAGPDRVQLDRAAAEVRLRDELPGDVVDDVVALLARERGTGPLADEAAGRFGQLTAPLAAKAVEDTAFYREVALPWLTEVGGDPGRSSVGLAAVGATLAELQQRWPGTFVPLTTHDTKRSADVRARLSRLAVDPDATARAFAGWHRSSEPHRSPIGPDPATEWLLWNALVGAWPIDADRLAAFAIKAIREAKDRTSWIDPDPAYEAAVEGFVRGVLADPRMVASIDEFVGGILAAGRATALALVVLAATATGTPDLYQGDELWNLSLVDPDNRRPVDHGRRAELLGRVAEPGFDLAAQWAASAHDSADEGLVKLATWHRLLQLRAREPGAFAAPHTPLPVDGPEGTLAFTRGERVAVVVEVRPADHGRVPLPRGPWHDVLTGTEHPGGPTAGDALLGHFPAAVLVRA